MTSLYLGHATAIRCAIRTVRTLACLNDLTLRGLDLSSDSVVSIRQVAQSNDQVLLHIPHCGGGRLKPSCRFRYARTHKMLPQTLAKNLGNLLRIEADFNLRRQTGQRFIRICPDPDTGDLKTSQPPPYKSLELGRNPSIAGGLPDLLYQ